MDEHPSVTPSTPEPIAYEETPIITPQPEPTLPLTETPPIGKPNKLLGFLKGLVFFIILFVVGFYLSGYLRDFFTQTAIKTPSPTPALSEQPLLSPESTNTGNMLTQPNEASGTPTTYSVLNGLTRQPVADISMKLPTSVLPPVCDGSACGSQGTYLPGGTRFTVAARGVGQVLADFRGKIISDAGGKPFIINQTTIAGKPATEFSTSQVGSTIGGYAFSRMHGYMIEITDTLSLEINHFSPSGITTDFAADDIVFASIVQSLMFGGTLKGSIIPTLIPTVDLLPIITPTVEPLAPIR